jgi:glycerophosphoryl diester phosphodiesterase
MFSRFLFLAWLLLAAQFSAAAVLSIGHRGNSLFAPENTLAAFTAALGKADLVELDGHVSSDGVIVVMHDSTVDRTTDGTGAISTKTLAQLKLLDAGSWFAPAFTGERIPTLEEALAAILPQATPLIERKAGSAEAYVAELRRLNAVSNVVVQSFDWPFLAAVNALEPGIRLGALGSGAFTAATLTNIMNTGARMVAWEKASVTPAMLDLVRSAGLTLFVWTVDGAQIQTFINMGVDGIISNDPGLVQQLQQTATNGPVDLAQGLVAYWKMDDGLADPWTTVVKDSWGTNAATLVRGDAQSHWFASPTAKFGGCLMVEGLNASVTLPQTPALDINTNGLTMSAWVKLRDLPSQLTTSYGAIFDSTTDCYVFYLDRSNKELRFKITDAATHAARPGISESLLTTNEWIHVVGTYSGRVGPVSGQATIYLNGQPRDVHTGSDNTSPFGLTNNVKSGQIAAIGREGPAGGNYYYGGIDDLAIWNRALSPAEVAWLYEQGMQGRELGQMVRAATPLLRLTAARHLPAVNKIEIDFQNSGPWQSFRLLRALNWGEAFAPVIGLSPVALGGGAYRFSCPLGTNGFGLFRVEAQ